MSKLQQIKDTFLHELTASEERAKRAIKLLQYQDSKIGKLESVLHRKEQEISGLSENQQREQAAAVEEYEMIQREMQTIRATLKELHRVQQNWIAENEMLRQVNKKSQLINASASIPPVKPGSDEASRKFELQSAKKTRPATTTSEAQVQTQDTFEPRVRTAPQPSNMASQSNSNIDELFKNFSQQLTKINEKLDQRQASESDINQKLGIISSQVELLKKERDVVKVQVTQLTSRYKNIEGAILDIHSGVSDPEPDFPAPEYSYYKPLPTKLRLRHEPNLWRTARRFFTPEEADHFLSALTP